MGRSITDLSFVEVTYEPTARCTQCPWEACPATVMSCKGHVFDTGHRVTRTRVTDAAYFIQGNQEENS